ncbi:PAS domain S-box protein [Brasilonema bromeliae]|uniref:PAS domain S-box protein n=1 Tax=Brasilonema bromeliae TaxID=383615 RepID=UPI00145E9E8B
MNLNDFYRQMIAARQRAAELCHRANESFFQEKELLVLGYEELYATLSKLEVAFEELHQINWELACAHQVVQMERQRYRNLFEFIPNAYLVTDGKGIIQDANKAAAMLLGVQQYFLVGKPLVIFICWQERRAFLSKLLKLHLHHQTQEWEVRLCLRNGDSIDATLTVSIADSWGGKLNTLGWLIRPITERKQVDPAPWLLSNTVQYATESIIVTEANLDEPGPKIVFVNPACTKITGYTSQEMIGKTPRMLQGPKTERSVLYRLRRNLSQGQFFHGELINYRKDDTEYNMELFCAPIHNERGDITHFFSIQRQIIPIQNSKFKIQN